MIATLRRTVHGLLKGVPAPLHLYLPGSVDDLPAVVVGRPSVAEGVPRAVVAVNVPVYVLGRTIRDDDAQLELDDLADVVLKRLWTPPGTEGVAIRLTTMQSAVIEIAGIEIPAYNASVACETTFC